MGGFLQTSFIRAVSPTVGRGRTNFDRAPMPTAGRLAGGCQAAGNQPAAGCWRPGGCLQGERRTDGRAGCVAPGRRPFRAGWPPPSSLDGAAQPGDCTPTWWWSCNGTTKGTRCPLLDPRVSRIMRRNTLARDTPGARFSLASFCALLLTVVCDCTGSLSIYE